MFELELYYPTDETCQIGWKVVYNLRDRGKDTKAIVFGSKELAMKVLSLVESQNHAETEAWQELYNRPGIGGKPFKITLSEDWSKRKNWILYPGNGAKLRVVKTFPFNWWRKLLFVFGIPFTSCEVVVVKNEGSWDDIRFRDGQTK